MQLRACLFTVLALTVASLAYGSFRELEETTVYTNPYLDGELAKDCILAGGRSSCVNFTKVTEECAADSANATYTVHVLLGPMYGTEGLLNDTLPALVGETDARWYVQNRSSWDNSLLDLSHGRSSFYDCLVLDPALVPEMVAYGALMSLEPFIEMDRWGGYWPGILSVLRWQVATTGNVMIPLGAAAIVLHYRTDVLSSHNLAVPRTWEQLLAAVGAVHGKPEGPNEPDDPEFYGFCTMPVTGCHSNSYELLALWASFIQTRGHDQGAFFDPETFTPLVRNKGMRAALLYYRQLCAFAPPFNLANTTNCSSMYGTAEPLYAAGKCAFQLAPHPSHKYNMRLSMSPAVRNFSRVTWLPGATSILDRPTGRLLSCSPANCPFGEEVPVWPGDAELGNAVLSGDNDGAIVAAAKATAAAAAAAAAAGKLPSSFVFANMAPVLGLSPLALGINNFTSRRQKAYSINWLRRVTNPETIRKLVVSPSTPLAPFRYEHFSASNLRYWTEAGYDEERVSDYLALSYSVLTHGNLLSYPMMLQRMLQYRTALHHAAYDIAMSGKSIDAIMDNMSTSLAIDFGPKSYGFGILRLQYLRSLGRYDLLAAPAPPPPPPPPQIRYIVGHEVRPRGVPTQGAGAAVGGAMGSLAAAAMLTLAAFLYRRLMVERGWGRIKDPGVGHETTLVVTDIESSTVLWEELDALVMDVALNLHHETIRRVITQWSGYESVTEGDSFTVAFHTAEAAVGFSLHVQSELMDQPWPPEVLRHATCRPVYVVGTKRLRHLVAKAAAMRPAAQVLEALDPESAAGSGRSTSLFARSSGVGAVGGGGGGGGSGGGSGAVSGASARLALPLPLRTLSKGARRLDLMMGLSMQLRRSMSFISRPASGSSSTRGSLLALALAGGGSGTAATISGGGRYGGAAAAVPAAAAATAVSAYGGGSSHAQAMSGRAATGDGVLFDATPPYESTGFDSSRNLFDHFLPYSGAAAPPRIGPGGTAAAVAAAAAAGSMSMSLSLGKLPASLVIANASGVGGGTTAVAGAGFAFGNWAGRTPSVAGRRIIQSSPQREDDERNDSGTFALQTEVNVTAADISASGITDGGGGGSGTRLANVPAGLGHGPLEQPLLRPPSRVSSILAAAATAPGLLLSNASSVPRSVQIVRVGSHSIVGTVPEEPSFLPSPLSRPAVLRTHSTQVGGGSGIGDGGGGGGGDDLPPPSTSLSMQAGVSGSGMIFGSQSSLRSPFKTFTEGRRPSRLADPPPSLYQLPAPDDRRNPTAADVMQGSSQAALYLYGSRSPDIPRHAHDESEVTARGPGQEHEQPSLLNQLRKRHGLDADTDAGRPGPTGQLLRGWRSWTGSSLDILRKMQRSFRHVTLVAASAPKMSFSGARSSEGGSGGGGGGDGGPGATSGPPPAISNAAEAVEVVSRDAVAASGGWEVESRSSSQSHGPPSSVSHGSTIQSALQLHPSRRGGGGAKSGGKTLYASPSTYGSELRATWTELPYNLGVDPASVGAVLAFRGFRVRCGIHSGVRTVAEVNRNHPSGRTRYSGPALLCAKAVSDAAHGGMVFASRHAVALCSAQFLASRVVLWRLGDYVLGSPRLPATLYQLSNTALVLRAALQRPLTRTVMPLGLGLLDAPLSVVACAVIRLASIPLLEEAPPDVSIEAASIFQALSYQYARLHGGYVTQLGVGRAMCIFPDAYRAALWAALVANGMLTHSWSDELLATQYCGVRSILDSQGREVQVARGPRIQAVVHFGAVSTLLHPLTGQLSYEGGAIDMTMRLLNGLSTTGVVATLEAAASLRRYRPVDAARAAALDAGGAANGSNNSNGPPPSQQVPSSSRCRTDVDGGGGDATGSASQRSSAATWREITASVRQQQQQQQQHKQHQSLQPLHLHHQHQQQHQQQDGPLSHSRSSTEHFTSLVHCVSRDAGGSSSGDNGGGGSSPRTRIVSHGPPLRIGGLAGRSRVVASRRASGPTLGRGSATVNPPAGSPDGMLAATAAAASSFSWRRGDDGRRGASPTQRSGVPRAASAVIPAGTDSTNTSGTDGTDGGTAGCGGGSRDSRRDSQIESGGVAGARRGSTQQLSLNLGAMPTLRAANVANASTAGGTGGDAAARAAALAAASGGMCNDSLLLLLTMSGELPQTATLAGYTGPGGGTVTGGGQRECATASLSGGNPLLGWMISGGVPLGSAAANAMVTNTQQGGTDSNLVSASDLRPDESIGGDGSTATVVAVAAAGGKGSGGRSRENPHATDVPAQQQQQQQGRRVITEVGFSGAALTPAAALASTLMKIESLQKSSKLVTGEPCQAPPPPGLRAASTFSSTYEPIPEAAAVAAVRDDIVKFVSSEPPPPRLNDVAVKPPPSEPAADPNTGMLPTGAPSMPSNDASDCRPPAVGVAGSSQSVSSGGSMSPSSPVPHKRRNNAHSAAAAAAAAAITAAATGASSPSLLPTARQSVESAVASSNQPSDSAEPSSDPEAAPSTTMVPLPTKRPPQPCLRQLRPQQSGLDSPSGRALGPERVYQSFTFGQKGSAMVRPRLQDLLSVSPYTSMVRAADGEVATAAGGELQSADACGGGGHGDSHYARQMVGPGGGGAAAVGGDGMSRVVTGVERGPPGLPSDPSGRAWGGDLPSLPSNRTGYAIGQGSSSLEALLRGPNGRMSRSFTFTTHRRSPLAVSSYAGDPEVGAVTSGTGAGAAGGGMRQMSSLSRVLNGAVTTAVGLVSREAAAVAGGGYEASRETTPRGSSQGPYGAAAAAAAAAAASIGVASTAKTGRRDSSAVAASPANAGGSRSGSGSGVQVYRSPSMTRGNRGRRGSTTHPQGASNSAAAGSLISGPFGAGSLQPWAVAAGAVGATVVSPFSLPSEYAHSSNSAGTLQMSLNSAQLRTSIGELRGSGHDGRGSGATSAASATTSPPNMEPSNASAAMASSSTAATVQSTAGHFSGIIARVRGSMAKSRSRSLSRAFVSAITPIDAAPQTVATLSREGTGDQGLVQQDSLAAAATGSGDASGPSIRLPAPCQFPSGSSTGGAGGGGGIAAAASRTLRGLMLTEKLPTLPEGGLSPLMREIRHLKLRLVPLRLAARGAASTSRGPPVTAAQGIESTVFASGAGELAPQEQYRNQQSYGTGRNTEYMQVYRVTLLAPDPVQHHLAAAQPSPLPSSPIQVSAALAQAASQPQFQQPQSRPQGLLPQTRSTGTIAAATAGQDPNAPRGKSLEIGASYQSQVHTRSVTDPECGISCTGNAQDLGVRPREVMMILPSGDGEPSHSMTIPMPSGGCVAGAAGEVEELGEAALVNQFLSGFTDLSDPQLAELWAAHPERLLLQDRRPANVAQLRVRLAAQAAQEAVFNRDNFLF